MTFDEYQALALRTEAPHNDLTCAALGLAGESAELFRACIGVVIFAGNFADLTKKHTHHGHELDRTKAAKELGDALWYLALAAKRLGLTLDEVAGLNIAKLKERYPAGWDAERSKLHVEAPALVIDREAFLAQCAPTDTSIDQVLADCCPVCLCSPCAGGSACEAAQR